MCFWLHAAVYGSLGLHTDPRTFTLISCHCCRWKISPRLAVLILFSPPWTSSSSLQDSENLSLKVKETISPSPCVSWTQRYRRVAGCPSYRRWIVAQSKQYPQVSLSLKPLWHCWGSVWVMACVSLCLSDQIRCSPWFIMTGRTRPLWRLSHWTFRAFNICLMRVFLYWCVRALCGVCVCLCWCACEKVWESPFPPLLCVDCEVKTAVKDKTGRKSFTVFLFQDLCIRKN